MVSQPAALCAKSVPLLRNSSPILRKISILQKVYGASQTLSGLHPNIFAQTFNRRGFPEGVHLSCGSAASSCSPPAAEAVAPNSPPVWDFPPDFVPAQGKLFEPGAAVHFFPLPCPIVFTVFPAPKPAPFPASVLALLALFPLPPPPAAPNIRPSIMASLFAAISSAITDLLPRSCSRKARSSPIAPTRTSRSPLSLPISSSRSLYASGLLGLGEIGNRNLPRCRE